MKNKTLALGLLALFLTLSAFAQTVTLTSTTTSTAVLAADKFVCLASATGVVVPGIGTNGSMLYIVDATGTGESATVRSLNSTGAGCFNVVRSTRPVAHASGTTVYLGTQNSFYTYFPAGTCTVASMDVRPWINIAASLSDPAVYDCVRGLLAPLTGPTLAYLPTGVQQPAAHSVYFTCTLGTNCAITLTGQAAFTSATSYFCSATDQTSAAAVKIVNTSGTVVTLTGTGTDVLSGSCLGN